MLLRPTRAPASRSCSPPCPRRVLLALFVVHALACRPTGSASDPQQGTKSAAVARSGAAGECPPGTLAAGAPPPQGDRAWCERPDGVMHGPVVSFYPGGERRAAGRYADGVKDGDWRSWYEGGKLRAEEHYRAGRPHGTWIEYFEDGTRASEATHVDDTTIELVEYRPDGGRLRAGTYVNGREHGTWTEWDAQGSSTTVEWRDGARIGGTAVGRIGISECDEYVEKYSRCIAAKVPAAARGAMNDAMDATVKAWTEAAQGPARDGLASACKAALDAARQVTRDMGCEW